MNADDVTAVREAVRFTNYSTDTRVLAKRDEGLAALDRLEARLQEAERERDMALELADGHRNVLGEIAAREAALREACERIAELTDGPAYPPALGHAIALARAALAADLATGRPWLPGEAAPHRVPPRECVAAARRALDKTYGLGQGQAAIPLLIEAVDWLRRALEQMVESS